MSGLVDITPADAPGQVRIRRDDQGIPHIEAGSQPDAYWGLGWVHACDRGLQMLLMRILGRAEASLHLEASDQMLSVDRFFARMAFTAGANGQVALLGERARRCSDAYAAGANARFARHLPWELKRLLRYRPDPWTPADAVLLSRMAGFLTLAQSQWEIERLLVEMVQAGVARTLLDELFPQLLGGLDETLVRQVTLGERLVPESVAWLRGVTPVALGSNNWVVCGARTRSGAPLLANDPHLEGNRLPCVWAEVGMRWPGVAAVAATMPGLPGLLLGRTERLAWGATYAFMDAVDSWIEECRDGQFRRGDRWIPFRRRQHAIGRKGKPAIEVVFFENDHGVLDGDATRAGLYLATRWTGAGGGAASLESTVRLPDAHSVTEGMQALGRVETAFNWVLADRDGHIGYQMSGHAPMRAPGRSGFVPLPGWDAANDWLGLVPLEDLPRAYDPPDGYFVTANQDLNAFGNVPVINMAMGEHRAKRIQTLLGENAAMDVDAARRMQLDLYSLQADEFLEVLRPLLPDTPSAATLRTWDRRYDTASVGATLFEAFYRTLRFDVFSRAIGLDAARFLQDETGTFIDFYANVDRVLLDEHSAWFLGEPRDAVWRRALPAIVGSAAAAPPTPWGDVQPITMRHLLLGGKVPGWSGFDYGPLPLPGGRATVQQGQVYRSAGRDTSFLPSFRMVIDLAQQGSHTALAGGPSDRRFSRWYRSGVEDWMQGRLKEVLP